MTVIARFVCFLIFVGFFFGCHAKPIVRSNEGTLEPKTETAEENLPAEESAEFEGVSFRFDPRVFGNVKQEVVPERKLEQADHKPDYVAPKHVRFEFELGEEHNKAEMLLFAIDEFPNAYAVSSRMVELAKKDTEALRKVLKDPTYRVDGSIPHLLFEDVSHDFYIKVRDFDFQNGDGIIFVTHWTHGADFISNRNLIYRYEGITADGKFYVTAEMPVTVDFLPDDSPSEFEGYTEKDLMDLTLNSNGATAKYEGYVKSITTRLEKLGPSDFSPSLEKLESIIASLKVTR